MAPDERSPLLASGARRHDPAYLCEAGSSIAPEGVESRDINPQVDSANSAKRPNRGDIERQPSNSDISEYQGMPEVKKRMKYIFPAVCVGVCSR